MEPTVSNRNKLRRTIRALDDQISEIKSLEFGADDLKRMGIRLDSSGTTDEPGFHPCFFKPYPSHDLTAPDDRLLSDFPEYEPELAESCGEKSWERALFLDHYLTRYVSSRGNALDNSGWEYRDVEAYKFRPLLEYDPPTIPQWWVTSICHHGLKTPHLKATMISHYDGHDTRLLRCELLALIRMTRGRPATKAVSDHAIHPILLFSMMGIQHMRILQAHMDDTTLVIQQSKLYDFRYLDVKPLEIFTQWFLSSPIGDTMSKTIEVTRSEPN